MKTIPQENFDNKKPDFDSGTHKWYLDSYFNDYIRTEQKDNLPKLKGLGCFVVISNDGGERDYVLIDGKQNVLSAYPYTVEGYGQMEAKINILKVLEHYERNDV